MQLGEARRAICRADRPARTGQLAITGASFILVHTQSHDHNTAAALKFFDGAYHHGQSLAQQLDYVPIPVGVVKLVESKWSALQVDGQPVWPAK